MSNLKIAGFQSNLVEELDDADLMSVVGGNLVGGLVTGVADANNAIGNGGRPTTGAVGLVANTLIGTGQYLNTVNGGLEGGLQAVNGTVAGTASQV
ncbi:MAG: hypothetical protein KME49_20575 [Brasilonema octagenarum HA4186-MV1]|jgi:hypothetical protein|nr:hypothetical protein [Brasilonema octagenarum HA4186-MV1]